MICARGGMIPSMREGFLFIITPETSVVDGFRVAAANAIRKSDRAKRLFLAHKTYVAGTSLYMVATKPVSQGAAG